MDLRSRHPEILEQDFLLIDSETEHRARWNIISLSLVVNFVPESKDRGS
jgi:25S rRNA (adenine2142-N1)-methyltransferase